VERTSQLLDSIQRDLYTAVICDSLDELGLRNQAMRPNLRPVYPKASMAGWARTISCCDLYHIPEDPYGKEIEAIDSLLPGEVAVVGTGESTRNAPWGELLSTAATARGALGAVVDGLVRDVYKIEAIPFPVFAAGLKPVDSQGRGIVTDYNLPVECGGVWWSVVEFWSPRVISWLPIPMTSSWCRKQQSKTPSAGRWNA
jgi:4-hydroxy-4-methyl-2-oxoglutarate aldolase